MSPTEIAERFAEQAALLEAMRVAFVQQRPGYAESLLISYLTLPRKKDLGDDPRFCPSCWHLKSWSPHAPHPVRVHGDKERWHCEGCRFCWP